MSPWVPILSRADADSVIGPARLARVLRGLDTAGGVAGHQALSPRRTLSGHGPMLSLLSASPGPILTRHWHRSTPYNTYSVRRSDFGRPEYTADSIILVQSLEYRKNVWFMSQVLPQQLSSQQQRTLHRHEYEYFVLMSLKIPLAMFVQGDDHEP